MKVEEYVDVSKAKGLGARNRFDESCSITIQMCGVYEILYMK
jgi:hypothetical protein